MEDITGVHVEIDDLLCKGAKMEEVLSRLRKVLTRCREKNIKLARHKLEFRKETDFAGTHLVGPEGYQPTTAKISIINLPAPTNITELRSFLGCWNQLCHYLPNYQHSVSHMQKLLRKDVSYEGDQNMQAEFNGIKQILKSPLGLKPFNKNWRIVLYTDYSSKGVGFTLTQENPEDETVKQLIFCGSSSLPKTETPGHNSGT